MPEFKVSHINEQGVDLIIIPLHPDFQYKTDMQKKEVINELQTRANNAGLAGTVVPMWRNGNRVSFIAPPNWHPFFSSLAWNTLMNNLNKKIFW